MGRCVPFVITVSRRIWERLMRGVIVVVIQVTAASHKPAEFKFQILFSGTNSIATLLTEH